MSENETVSAESLNAATGAALVARASEARTEAAPTPKRPAAKRPAAKPAPKPAAKPAPKPAATSGATGTRRALTPAERAERPPTATIVNYVKWLRSSRGIGEAKFSKLSRADLAAYAITLYGSYQISDERRNDRANGR